MRLARRNHLICARSATECGAALKIVLEVSWVCALIRFKVITRKLHKSVFLYANFWLRKIFKRGSSNMRQAGSLRALRHLLCIRVVVPNHVVYKGCGTTLCIRGGATRGAGQSTYTNSRGRCVLACFFFLIVFKQNFSNFLKLWFFFSIMEVYGSIFAQTNSYHLMMSYHKARGQYWWYSHWCFWFWE